VLYGSRAGGALPHSASGLQAASEGPTCGVSAAAPAPARPPLAATEVLEEQRPQQQQQQQQQRTITTLAALVNGSDGLPPAHITSSRHRFLAEHSHLHFPWEVHNLLASTAAHLSKRSQAGFQRE